MSYTKYKTKGIIVGGSNIGEASRSYNIFTRDFGLIRVRAQGIRELNSKLKYHLQNLSMVNISLVKGKSGWRVTDAKKIKSLPYSFNATSKRKSSTRVLLFIKRMLPEEGENKELFDIIIGGFDFMEPQEFPDKNVSALEALIVLRTLRKLGYVENNHKFDSLLEDSSYNHEILEKAKKEKFSIIKEINESIKASEL